MAQPLAHFKEELKEFGAKNRRQFPWRKSRDPYAILVSEIMLQQTQTSRVVPYFEKFLVAWPTVEKLAAANPAEVLGLWQGLGYNRRALFLQAAAKKIVADFGGRVPTIIEDLTKLPGVGVNTAGAILAYAFNQPAIFIETNIRKTIIHFFFSTQEKVSDKEIAEKIKEVIDKQNPREWYWAVVDYGSRLGAAKTVTNDRSAHHQKQSQFVGSKRFTRSQMLKLLLRGPQPKKEIMTRFESLPYADQALAELLSEGFCVKEGTHIRIRD